MHKYHRMIKTKSFTGSKCDKESGHDCWPSATVHEGIEGYVAELGIQNETRERREEHSVYKNRLKAQISWYLNEKMETGDIP